MSGRLANASALFCLALTLGCSSPAPEERLIEAGNDIQDTESRLTAINAEIASHQQAIQELRRERQKARSALETLEERLARRASDLAIFRAAQGALLDERQLEDAVVIANVDDGVVTLEGTVSSASKERRASEIVASIPGVRRTVNRLQLVGEAEDHGR